MQLHEIQFFLYVSRILGMELNNVKIWKINWRVLIHVVSQQFLLKYLQIRIFRFWKLCYRFLEKTLCQYLQVYLVTHVLKISWHGMNVHCSKSQFSCILCIPDHTRFISYQQHDVPRTLLPYMIDKYRLLSSQKFAHHPCYQRNFPIKLLPSPPPPPK